MSRLRDKRHRKDRYHQRAKAEHYASRAVYKLEEIDRRFKLFRRGGKVLDLGCRPGSWLQYAAERIGPEGRAIGIDRQSVDIALPAQATTLVGDIYQTDAETLKQGLPHFDVLLSDMAPDTTGIRSTDSARSVALYERALALAAELVRPGGSLVAKIFQGEGFDEALRQTKALFKRTKVVKPAGSRKESREQYVVGLERRP